MQFKTELLPKHPGTLKTKQDLVTTITESVLHQCSYPKIYGLPIHKVGTPLGPLFLVGGLSHMGWPGSWPT